VPWPFNLFGRSRSEGPSPETPAAAPPPPRASGREWTALPPIQRAAGSQPLTASARDFASGLPGSVGVPLALQPLGHARSLEAPSGLVTGLATYSGSERFVYVQRRPAGQPGMSWPEPAEASPAVEAPAQAVVPAVVEPIAAEVEAPALPPPPAPRAVAAVAAAPAPAPLTVSTLPETALPFAPVVGSRAARSEPAPSAPAADPSPAIQAAAEAEAPGELPMADSGQPRRLNVGQSRRLRLGAPLAPAAGQAAVHRSFESPPAPLADGPAPAPVAEPPAALQVPLPVQRRMDASVAPPAPDVPVELGRPIFRVQRRTPAAPAPAARPDAPLVGRRAEPSAPMPVVREVAPASAGPAPVVPVQRAAAAPPAETPPAEPSAPAPDAPALPLVPVQRHEAPTSAVPAEPEPEEEPAADDLEVVAAQRLAADAPPPVDAAPLPVVPVQRVEVEPAARGPERLAPAAPGPLPVAPVQRRAEADPEPETEPALEEPEAPAEPVAQTLPEASVPSVHPLVPARRTGAISPASVDGTVAPPPLAMPLAPRSAPEPAPLPVVSRRLAGTPTPAAPPAAMPGMPALPLVGDRPLAVSTAAPAETLAGTTPAPTLWLPLAAADPVVQRLADAAPGAAPAWSARSTAEAASAALAPVARVARPVAQSMAAAQPAPAQPLPADLPYLPVATARPSDEPVAQRAPDPAPYLAIEVPIIQRADEAAPAPASGGTATGGATPHSDKELDELARQLYDRLRSRLRLELLVDRERAGLITDLRG
jgi:hypothetical protein